MMSAICFCFVPREGNRQLCLRQSASPNRILVEYLFALCFSRCPWMFRDGDLSLRSLCDDQHHPRDTLLPQHLFSLLPLLQPFVLPFASPLAFLLASWFRPQNLILETACALLEPSLIQHYLRTMPCFCSLLLERISMALSTSMAEHAVEKQVSQCFCC